MISLLPLEPRMLLSADVVGGHDHHHDDDSLLHVTPGIDEVLANEYAQTGEGGDVLANVLAPLGETFTLNSNAGASQTIYLDFDGHTTSGTSWNNAFNGGANFDTPEYDIDGVAGFSDTELQRIQYIWQRVAEDFIGFDVNVTTQDPGAAALIKSGSGDSAWGVRVAIGGSSFDWYGNGAGGVAYVGSFNSSKDTPTYVFTDQLGNGNEKYTAEAASHEAGHTLGLYHDGTSTSGYYTGHGSGETGWAPIMGVGYYVNLTQWSKGEYADASQGEDDLAIITGQNGFGYRADDHGSSTGSASALSVAGDDVTVSASGIIERNTDFDVFSFNTGAGAISLTIDPAARGANLDVYAELLNSSGQVIATQNLTGELSATINANVDAGTHYLRISGTGEGNPDTTGYTDYGSIGQYTVSGSIQPGVAPPPPPPPAEVNVSIADASTTEPDIFTKGKNRGLPKTTNISFSVNLSEAATESVSVNWTTVSGTALAGSDFTADSGTVVIAAGQTSATITVEVLGDVDIEGDETFTVQLTGASGATITDGVAVGTIVDNDNGGGDGGDGGGGGGGNGNGNGRDKNKAPVAESPVAVDSATRQDAISRIATFLTDSIAQRPDAASNGLSNAASRISDLLDGDDDDEVVSVFDLL